MIPSTSAAELDLHGPLSSNPLPPHKVFALLAAAMAANALVAYASLLFGVAQLASAEISASLTASLDMPAGIAMIGPRMETRKIELLHGASVEIAPPPVQGSNSKL